MEIEEIEEKYREEIEKAEKELSDSIENRKDILTAEENYRKKVGVAREKYYKSMSAKIKEKKIEKKKNRKEEKTVSLNIDSKKIKLSLLQRANYRAEIFLFKARLRTKSFFKTHLPEFVFVSYLKIKIKLKRIKLRVTMFLERMESSVVEFTRRTWNSAKDTSVNSYTKVMQFTEKIFTKFSKKKEESNSDQNK